MMIEATLSCSANTRPCDNYWTNCINIILGLLEDSILRSEERPHSRLTDHTIHPKQTPIHACWQLPYPSTLSSTTGVKRKRRSPVKERERKLQRFSSAVGFLSPPSFADTNAAHDDLSDPPSVIGAHSPLRKPFRRSLYANRFIRDSGAESPRMRQLSSHYTTMDLDQWLALQAQLQNQSVLQYKQIFFEKQMQLQYYLQQLYSVTDYINGDADQQFQDVKRLLIRIAEIVNDLSGDRSRSFSNIIPEWHKVEDRVEKLASYVQAIEDMRRFVTEIMPRTNDLLHDIQQLQAFLDLRVKMYDKNLAENGQAWKALGMMVDDQLIATAKEWIYRIALTLLEDIYTEHGKQRVSPVQDEQMMDCLLHGLEFVGSAMQFIGVSSVEITYRCQILADVYLQWISKALETLNNTSRKEIDSPCLPKLSINSKSMRPDLRLMHLMEHTSRLLTALQWVRDIRETHFDSPACVPQITATLVEICIRALSVVETIKNAGGHGSNYAASKRTNIMADPQVIIMHMEGSILAFAEKVILLSKEQTTFHHPSVQRLRSRLEDIESML